MTKDEIDQKRAARKGAHNAARDAQELTDLGEIDALEEAGGEPLHTMTTNAFRAGVPVKIAFRSPTAIEYKRYCDMVGRAQQANDSVGRRQSQELLASACLVYPPADSAVRKAMLETFPGVLISLAIEAAKVAELRAEDEGKG